MTEKDIKNLEFIFSLDPATFHKWWNELPRMEQAYATELVKRYRIDVNAYIMANIDDVDERMIEAKEVIDKVANMG